MVTREHGLAARLSKLQNEYLEGLWFGDTVQLVELLQHLIPYMSEPIADPMRRYYLDGTGQRKDALGRAISEDSMFYQYLQDGREILITFLRVVRNEPVLVEGMKEHTNG